MNYLNILLEKTMEKRIQSILYFIGGLIFLAIAIIPISYFFVIYYFNKWTSSAYFYFVDYIFYNLVIFSSFFFFLALIFINLGKNVLQYKEKSRLFSYKQLFYIIIYVALFAFFLIIIFPGKYFMTAPPAM